jgi:hypothetical protein
VKEMKRHKMVGWYNPVQLGRTAVDVLISTMLGKHADKRVLQAIADSGEIRPKYYYEVADTTEPEFWFDYIADVGDGFNSTYTMAYHITRPELSLSNAISPSEPHVTKKGKILIFGGDEVYPVAKWEVYGERLVQPYNLAYHKKTESERKDPKNYPFPAVFAIPGNHDWYDSLVAFTALLGREKEFCGWKCEQNRSYFAIKLPRGWWLFGTDVQLGSSLDEAQMSYFETIVKNHLQPDDRIILCNAEPHWITDKMYPKERGFAAKNMGYFEGHILNHQVAVHIAGDRHYYKRHEEFELDGNPVPPDQKWKIQKIVAGGGGAFLHPTHFERVNTVGIDHKYKWIKSYPKESTSWFIGLWNILFFLWNWRLGIVTGALYLLTSQAFLSDLGKFGIDRLPQAIESVVTAGLTKPIALFWFVLIVLGFFLFTDTHSKLYRFVGGFFHALAHLSAVFVIAWNAASYIGGGRLIEQLSVLELFELGGLIFAGGFIAGPTIMGLYLFVSLNIFGRHHNEAFSAIKIKGYKNFVRLKIEENGDLVIFPVGVDRIIKSWRKGDKKAGEAGLEPKKTKPNNIPFLIEGPIRFPKSEMPKTGPAKPKSDKAATADLLKKIRIDA